MALLAAGKPIPESGKLEFYAAWAAGMDQPELAARLRESAVRVRRMERSLDELVGDAAEAEVLAASAARSRGLREGDARGSR